MNDINGLTPKQQTLRKKLLREVHVLKTALNIKDEDWRVLCWAYREQCSTSTFRIDELIELKDHLTNRLQGHPMYDKILSPLRRRLYASVASWCEKMHYETTPEYVKGVIKRASGGKELNRMTAKQLTAVYAAFRGRHTALTEIELETINVN